MPSRPFSLRTATAQDAAAINEIYNPYVLNSTCTYQTEPDTLEARLKWLAARTALHPAVVAEERGHVIGWGSLSKFRERSAYDRTVENAVYVAEEHHRRGVGSALLAELIRLGVAAGHHSIIAVIDAEQPVSIALHARAGFAQVGRLREAGFKFGRWLDVEYMQRML
jgi:L-amino acid N-acyltransferase YncA